MKTQCHSKHGQLELNFQGLGSRKVVSRFDGGFVSSDGGALHLREVEARLRIIAGFAACFEDRRDPSRTDHSIEELVAQRVYGLALGYEDLNDHDRLRCDPMLALAVGKGDITGNDRIRERDRGNALAGKSSLNRLELSSEKCDRSSLSNIVFEGVEKEPLFA